MSAADCERWENRLLDLAYGEIQEGSEREVRAHLDGCDHCRKSLEKLQKGRALARQLPQLDAPADVMQVVLRAARDRALEVQAARAAAASAAQIKQEQEAEASRPAPKPARHDGWWSTILSIVMAPQFAMATLLLLTVGVGLWWFPGGPGTGGSSTALVSEPIDLAAGPEALTPAAPIRYEADPRTGRVEAHRDGDPSPSTRTADRRGVRPGPRAPVEPADDSEAAAIATLLLEEDRSAGAVLDGVLPELPRAESLGMEASGGTERVAAIPSTERAIPPDESLRATSPAMPSPSTSAASPSVASMDDAMDGPPPDGDAVLSAALLRQARELARAGRDREAIAQYEALLSRYRTSAQAPSAMMELAESYRRIGALSQARSWLERASAYPSVAAAARRELVRLDASAEAPVESAAAAEGSR